MGTTAAAIIAAIIGLVGTGVAAAANLKNQADTNKANREINQSQLDFNAAQTQAAWERDDTAHQREVADLEAAGLSPLAASGNGAMNSSPLSAPSPIAMQAPQFDVNSIIQSALGAAQTAETSRHNKAIEKYESGKLENEVTELSLKSRQLDIENKRVEDTIKYNAALLKIQADEIDEKIRSNKKGEELRLSEIEERMFEEESQRMLKEIQSQAGGSNIPYDVIHDFDIYSNRLKLWTIQFNTFIDSLQDTRSAAGRSQSMNGGFGINGSIPNTGVTAGASGNGGSSSSSHEYSDISKKQEAMMYQFYKEHPIPVYINKNDYKRVFKD